MITIEAKELIKKFDEFYFRDLKEDLHVPKLLNFLKKEPRYTEQRDAWFACADALGVSISDESTANTVFSQSQNPCPIIEGAQLPHLGFK